MSILMTPERSMRTITLYLFLTSLLLGLTVSQDAQSLTGLTFSNELKRMDRHGIGAPNLQEYYDSLIYDKATDTGAEIVQKMANNLGKMFETLTNQLQKVKTAIELEYEHFSSSDSEIFPQCCTITGNYNPKFRTKVSKSSACISKLTSSDHFPNQKIETVMKENYQRNPNMLWQYFGGSDGTFLIYPSHGFSPNCFSYDPRFR
ncbi:VWFA and cache domain-containing protein 1-like, partial [Saccostrea cucullata]|uniref:VWFA and cache domain-containing protein 1-like n=1 Tax=Saccostrea cuccullata TaxID=36930 RepID=UPI002ED1E0E6